MAPHWLQLLAIVSLCIAFLCAIVILLDIASGHRQHMAVMNVVWPITALYMGVIGFWAYWRISRAPLSKGGEQHVKQKRFWQFVFVGSTHCGAGCSLGDVVAEWVVFGAGATLAGSALYANFVWDFTAAYLIGIAFQYFAIVPMRHLGFRQGIKEAIKADTISLVAFEIGMFIWMALTSKIFFARPPHPDNAVYWFMMQIAMIVGFLTTYPANWFLIRRGVKAEM
jgi:hypothetical protein